MGYRADLHCHSTHSDGSCTPVELLYLAKAKGLSALSITDHDSLYAYHEESVAEAKKCAIDLLVGVEFSATYLGHAVHILGYALTITPDILSFCQVHQTRRRRRNVAILEKLAKYGILIEESELYQGKQGKSVGRVHIAEWMVKKHAVKTLAEAFHRFIGDGKSCFDLGEKMNILETIDAIHRAGGKAFIAHPHLIRKKSLLRDLLQMKFDGMECYYGSFPLKEQEKWVECARKHHLLISGGSDFHGLDNSHATLGASYVDREAVEAIFFR